MSWLITGAEKTPVDPVFNNVSLLLHGNGTNGSTTITDNSPTPKTVTAVGNAQISTAQSKFGGASIAFDGAGDYLTATYSASAFNWWTSDYTLETWVYATSFANWKYTDSGITQGTIIGNAQTVGNINYWSLGVLGDGRLIFSYFKNAVQTVTSTAAAELSQWNHIALTNASGQIRLWVNGVGTAPTSIAGTPQSSVPIGLSIGQVNSVSISGYIDDLRITKGVARYTANFTPPTAPFPDI
jgi:hypothetical protein